MKKLKLILLFILISYTFEQDSCGTPAECYIKSIGLLKQDRDEMRRERDKYEVMYLELAKRIDFIEKQNLNGQINTTNSKVDKLNSEIHATWKVINNNIGSFPISKNIIATPLKGVPKTAKKVLVYAFVKTGQSAGLEGDLRIFTKVNGSDQNRYLNYLPYVQNAWITNSGNFEFDLDGNDLNLYISASTAATGNINFSATVIGFK